MERQNAGVPYLDRRSHGQGRAFLVVLPDASIEAETTT